MNRPDIFRERVAFVTVVQRSAVSPLVRSKSSFIKHTTVPHPDVFWAYHFLKLMRGWYSNTLSVPFRTLDAFREEHLCNLKRFLLLKYL